MGIFLKYILAFTIVSVIAINYTVYHSVKMLLNPEKIIERVSKIDDKKFNRAFHKLNELAESLSFAHEEFFLFHGVIAGPPLLCASWFSAKEKTRMLVYMGGGNRNIDFVTKYSDVLSLTTGSTQDAMLLPYPPSYYVQAFTGIGTHAQYYRHLEARKLIEKKLNVAPILPNLDVLNEISIALKRQANYIMRLPYWYLRGVYWFLIQRGNKVNKRVVL